ncbi:MAG: carboxypeptidase-like regulatory domain-containing protein [bacterium]|nr:carboxypeptidase-like regulatory domain-containing protein [bacterium]
MTGRAALAMTLAAMAVVVTGLLLWLGGEDPATPPTPIPAEQPEDNPTATPTTRPGGDAKPAATAPDAPTGLDREPAIPPQDTPPAMRRADYPQGLEGRVLDRHSQAVPGVDVYLVESPKNDPLALPSMRAQGLLMGPVATTRTAADGAFAIGLALPTDKLYELRFLAPGWADARVADLRILPSEWHDVGRVTLRRGTTLTGQVTIAGTAMPVRGAVVTVAAPTSFDDAVLAAIPGREHGLHAVTGADGSYRLEHAPENAVVTVSATAPGFARVIKPEIDLSKSRSVEVHFALPPGVSIAGRVLDDRGAAVPGARIEAWAKASSTPPCATTSRADGAFEIDGLRAEPHRVRVLSRTHQGLEVDDVAAGERELELRLQPRATVRVRALGDDQVLRSFRLGLRRYHAARTTAATGDAAPRPAPLGQIGRVRDLPDRRARLVAGNDRFEIRGVPPGEYVAQVMAPGFAKTVSEPFTVEPTSGAIDVDVQLTRGATLRGRVVDANGVPLAGATVATQADGARPDNPFYRLIAPAAPDRITARTATTGPGGTFEFRHLAFGDYQLEIKHQQACREFAEHLYLRTSEPLELGDVRLRAGALVFGRATTNGRTTGQVKIVLTTYVDRTAKTQPTDALRLETVTDSTGAFTLPRRVPPGEYELRAAAIDASNPDGQVFQHMLQMARSATRLTIRPGQRAAEQHLNIASDG